MRVHRQATSVPIRHSVLLKLHRAKARRSSSVVGGRYCKMVPTGQSQSQAQSQSQSHSNDAVNFAVCDNNGHRHSGPSPTTLQPLQTPTVCTGTGNGTVTGTGSLTSPYDSRLISSSYPRLTSFYSSSPYADQDNYMSAAFGSGASSFYPSLVSALARVAHIPLLHGYLYL